MTTSDLVEKFEPERRALWLVAEDGCAVLKMERGKGDWIVLIRESLDGPFSHIIEPGGIQTALALPAPPTLAERERK